MLLPLNGETKIFKTAMTQGTMHTLTGGRTCQTTRR